MIGDILFVRGNSLLSKIINKVDGEYSHVALSLTNREGIEDVILEAQSFTDSRITKNYIEDYDIVRLKLTEHQKQKLLEVAITSVDYDYDYSQILNIFLNKLFGRKRVNDKNKLICSELIIAVLFEIGFLEIQDYLEYINCTPNELFELLISLGGEVIEC